MIVAVAVQLAKPSKEQELIHLMDVLTSQVKANEPGCKLFLYAKSKDKDRTYVVIEQYEDEKAFNFHHATSYLNSFLPKMMACLEHAPAVATYGDVTPHETTGRENP